MSEGKLTIGKAIDQIIEVLKQFEELDRKAIVNTICLHLQIERGENTTTQDEERTAEVDLKKPESLVPQKKELNYALDIRSLKEQKNPNSARQMACLVAYYLQEVAPQNERKDSISAADLEKYFKQASYKLPKHLEQLLVDAKTAGYFESAGRGDYSLTRVGYNLVAHSMPSGKQA